MKKIWKVLGVAALAVGFTPYRVEKDEETGEKKVQALLWQMTRKPMEEEKEEVSISFGFNSPARKENEAHLFSDDLNVEYAGSGEQVIEVEMAGSAAEEPAAAEEEAAEPASEENVEKEEPAGGDETASPAEV